MQEYSLEYILQATCIHSTETVTTPLPNTILLCTQHMTSWSLNVRDTQYTFSRHMYRAPDGTQLILEGQYSKEQSQLILSIRRLCSRHRLGESHKTWNDLLFLFSSHLSIACMTVSYAARSTYTRPHPEL